LFLNTKRFTLILLALIGVLALSGCTGAAGAGSNWPGLAADSETAYLADGSQIYGVRLSDHALMWKYPEKTDAKKSFYATPVLLGDGRLVISSAGTDHCLYVIDSAKIAADTKTPDATCFFAGAKDRWVAAPLVVENTVYAPNNDGSLYVVDLAGGSLLWSLEIGGSGHLWAAPVSDGTNLYIASLDHNLYAISLESHKVIWASDLGGSVAGSPAISADGKTLYVGSFASKIFALDTASGSVLWQIDTKDWVWGNPVVDGDVVYAADIEGQLYALDGANGEIVWSVKPGDAITGSPLVTADQIIVTTESGGVFAVDKQGKSLWPVSITGKFYTAAVQGGDLFLVAPLSTGAEFFLTAVSADGKVVWNFKPE
jgi:outer membrane protein assembly factor BamB